MLVSPLHLMTSWLTGHYGMQVAGELARIEQLAPIVDQILLQFGLGTVSGGPDVLQRLVSRLPRCDLSACHSSLYSMCACASARDS